MDLEEKREESRTPPARDQKVMSVRTDSPIFTPNQTKSSSSNPDSPRRLSFSSIDSNERIRKGSFDGGQSPKHSSGTTTMIFSLGQGQGESALTAQRGGVKNEKHIPNGDDVEFMIHESQGQLRQHHQVK